MKDNFTIDFIGVGAARSGTTWLFQCLTSHPEICTSHLKEVPFFNEEYNFNKGVDYYRDYFSHCENNYVMGEFNPDYLHDPDVPARIKDTFPHAKIIISLRDPIEALYSRYRFMKSRGMHSFSTFEAFIKGRPEYIKERKYSHHLERFYNTFDSENIHIILYDDIVESPQSVVRSLYTFLNVNPEHTPEVLQTKVHTSQSHPLLIFVKPIYWVYRLLQRSNLGKHFVGEVSKSPIRRYIEDELQRVDAAADTSAQPAYKENIQNDTLSFLESEFLEDIDKTESIINRDLSRWKNA